MLTDRPDVPRTPFGRLKPPNGVLGETQERAYNLNENLSGVWVIPLFIKKIIFAIRGHLQLLKVNFRTFQPKNAFLRLISDIVLLVALKIGYYCGNTCKACTVGQFTVLWCTEALLRQYITPLYETKLAIFQQTTDQE